jgi:aromatic ring-opening dioxygenase LigB subunit
VIPRLAVVPHPPLLVPELVGGAADETEPLRAACLAVTRDLADSSAHWVAIATDPSGPRTLGPDVSGTFRGYGVDVPVALSAVESSSDPDLPLPALIAGWLRGAVGALSVRVELVHPDLSPEECVSVGKRLAEEPDVGVLVLGTGSHRHGDAAVGRPDDRAGAFDTAVRAALAAADPDALLDLDPALAAELGADGRAAWQVLAGLAQATGPWRCARSEFLVPYGVGYHLSLWESDTAGT